MTKKLSFFYIFLSFVFLEVLKIKLKISYFIVISKSIKLIQRLEKIVGPNPRGIL